MPRLKARMNAARLIATVLGKQFRTKNNQRKKDYTENSAALLIQRVVKGYMVSMNIRTILRMKKLKENLAFFEQLA